MPKKIKKPVPKVTNTKDCKNYCKQCKKFIIGNSYKFQCHLFGYHKAVKPRFTCEYCFKEYYRADTYARHVSIHTGKYKNIYVCDYCDRGFVDKRNLIHHLKIHDDSLFEHPTLKQYRCLACHVTYAEKRSLEQHIRRLHYSSKQNEPEYLKKPLMVSWVERVLDSNVCVQLTKLNNNVITIKKVEDANVKKVKPEIHASKFIYDENQSQFSKAICDYCKKEMIKKSLRQHIKERHFKIRKFSCEFCPRTFMRHYQMVNHQCQDGRTNKKSSRISSK